MRGGSLASAARELYSQGGVARLYQGLLPALLQAPLCRFGDTAANEGVLSLLAGARWPALPRAPHRWLMRRRRRRAKPLGDDDDDDGGGGFDAIHAAEEGACAPPPAASASAAAAAAAAAGAAARRPLPLWLKTGVASACASAWRALLTPLDTAKLVLELDGFRPGVAALRARVSSRGVAALWAGWAGVGLAAAASHWPWFGVHNVLTQRLPPPRPGRWPRLVRSAAVGFAASLVSDVAANPLRVLKSTVQTAAAPMSYLAAARAVAAADGPAGLFTRGLGAKICINALQGVVFSVLWAACRQAYAARWAAARAQGGAAAAAAAAARPQLKQPQQPPPG